MVDRKLICPDTEAPCTKGCKIGFCALEREQRLRDQRQAEAERESVDLEARKLAPAYFKKRGIKKPTEAQIRRFIAAPKVRALATERLTQFRRLPPIKL
jgi:hypothetical protein